MQASCFQSYFVSVPLSFIWAKPFCLKASLNNQYASISEQIEDLNRQIADKEKEIEQTQADLEEAKRVEEKQYEDMKIRTVQIRLGCRNVV